MQEGQLKQGRGHNKRLVFGEPGMADGGCNVGCTLPAATGGEPVSQMRERDPISGQVRDVAFKGVVRRVGSALLWCLKFCQP